MKYLYLALFLSLFSFSAPAQLHPFNEISADLLGHSLGVGGTYRRTLDVNRLSHYHGLFSLGITSGMLSNYVGFGYRYGEEWFFEIEGLAGYNSIYGARKRVDNPSRIQSGLSYGGHVNFGSVTIDDYIVRLQLGYHHFQTNYGKFILGMQVGVFFD